MKKHPYQEVEINTADIIVPHSSYQRPLNMRRVKEIADHFDERLANMPKVSFRDGNYYVFDGQHTIAARKLLNDGEHLPIMCRVYYDLSESDEAMLFSQQFGASRSLQAGTLLRARIIAGDPAATAFMNATQSVGIDLDFSQNIGKNRIGCISTAFREYQSVGEEDYVEALSILKEAWRGQPDSLRYENVQSLIKFVNLYKGEYSRDRLVRNLKKKDPMAIREGGRKMGMDEMAGYKKYLYQVLLIYNGSNRTDWLPLKF